MTDYAIQVKGLRKSYQGRAAVDGIDLDVRRGEVFALLGPNGAGKTTTVEILEGYRRRDGGEVRVLGDDPADGTAAWKSRIGIVLQRVDDLAQSSELTVREWVGATAAYFPDPRPPDETIELVGLARQAATPGRARCPAASAAGWTSRSASSAGPSCSSWTSRPPASTRRRAASSGGCSRTWPSRAPRSCSPPTTWTRPSTWPTGSR